MSARGALDLCRWLQGLGLRPTCLLVAHAIAHRIDGNGRAWPSLRRLARDTGLARSTVAVALNDLEVAAVITRERRRRSDGQHVATVYSFVAQWDLFKGKGGVVRKPDNPSPVSGQASLTERISFERASVPESNQSQAKSNDAVEWASAYDAAIQRALALGYEGDLRARDVAAFLHARDSAGGQRVVE